MSTIQDYIDNKENIKVRIDRREDANPYDPLFGSLWEGMLKDIPEEYRKLEVMNEGWIIYARE